MSLRRFNVVMGILHLAQGAAMLALSSEFSLPINASFPTLDPATSRLAPDPRTLVDLRIGWLVATFLFLSAIAHLLIASPRSSRSSEPKRR